MKHENWKIHYKYVERKVIERKSKYNIKQWSWKLDYSLNLISINFSSLAKVSLVENI